MRLGIGRRISLTNGKSITVGDMLGEGGQGEVYKVALDGKSYALKWYTSSDIIANEAFYKNLRNNIESGTPSDKFLWPKFLTEKSEGSFGYVMDLRPSGYNEFAEFLVAKKVFFDSHAAQINAALNITEAFRDLHRKGYSYQDLNDGNFFINAKTGDVLVCDNDNVAPNGENLGIKGKARYMAPEIVRNISKPDKYSDYFSLSVILFELMFFSHPLEGERLVKHPCLTEDLELLLYGKEPIFIFDPENAMNRPVQGIHNNAIRYWSVYPEYLRDKFRKAFSYKAMNSGDLDVARRERIMDNDWRKTFISLRSGIIRCPRCSEEIMLNIGADTKCPNPKCGNVVGKTHSLSFMGGKYRIPVYPGIEVLGCMTDDMGDDRTKRTGFISTHPQKPGVLGIRNDSSMPWTVRLKDGTVKPLEPGKSISFGVISEISFKQGCSADVID